MKTALTISIAFLSVIILTACTNSRQADQLSRFLDDENLRITSIHANTTDTGYDIAIVFVDANDTNRIFHGWMHLEDVEIGQALDLQHRAERAERARQVRTKTATSTNLLLRLGCSRGNKSGWITHARPLDSDRIAERFPHHRFKSVDSSSVQGPAFIAKPLVIGTNLNASTLSTVFVLGNASTVASFITEHNKSVDTIDEARETLALFCELLSWSIVKAIPEEVDGWSGANDPEWISRWTYREVETEDGWGFQTVLLTDPHIRSYSHYDIQILRNGTITVKDKLFMGSAGGYL